MEVIIFTWSLFHFLQRWLCHYYHFGVGCCYKPEITMSHYTCTQITAAIVCVHIMLMFVVAIICSPFNTPPLQTRNCPWASCYTIILVMILPEQFSWSLSYNKWQCKLNCLYTHDIWPTTQWCLLILRKEWQLTSPPPTPHTHTQACVPACMHGARISTTYINII